MDWLFSSATKLWKWRNYLHSCFPFNLLHVINGYNIFVSFHESGKIRKILRTCINQRYLPRDIWGEKSRLKKKKVNLIRPKGEKKKKKLEHNYETFQKYHSIFLIYRKRKYSIWWKCSKLNNITAIPSETQEKKYNLQRILLEHWTIFDVWKSFFIINITALNVKRIND